MLQLRSSDPAAQRTLASAYDAVTFHGHYGTLVTAWRAYPNLLWNLAKTDKYADAVVRLASAANDDALLHRAPPKGLLSGGNGRALVATRAPGL